MPSNAADDARLNFRLPLDLKQTIEKAAVRTGQTVSDFAVSTLVQSARIILEQEGRTKLSQKDRGVFLSLLDDKDARPNEALKAAAGKHRRRRG
jgi:uncharacterized protein (DUF1778 family)